MMPIVVLKYTEIEYIVNYLVPSWKGQLYIRRLFQKKEGSI